MARPKFCPNCAAPFPEGTRGAIAFGDAGDRICGWDCFCAWCHWSGDILPDEEDAGSTSQEAPEVPVSETPARKEGWAKQSYLRKFHWFNRQNITACGARIYIPDRWALPGLPDSDKCRVCLALRGQVSMEGKV